MKGLPGKQEQAQLTIHDTVLPTTVVTSNGVARHLSCGQGGGGDGFSTLFNLDGL